jgi:hypothetical protein
MKLPNQLVLGKHGVRLRWGGAEVPAPPLTPSLEGIPGLKDPLLFLPGESLLQS